MWHVVSSQQMIVPVPPHTAQLFCYGYLLYHSGLNFGIKSLQWVGCVYNVCVCVCAHACVHMY